MDIKTYCIGYADAMFKVDESYPVHHLPFMVGDIYVALIYRDNALINAYVLPLGDIPRTLYVPIKKNISTYKAQEPWVLEPFTDEAEAIDQLTIQIRPGELWKAYLDVVCIKYVIQTQA